MSRRYTRRGTALLLVLAFLVSMLGAALPVMQKSGAASGTFATFCYRLYCSVGESPGGAGGFRA